MFTILNCDDSFKVYTHMSKLTKLYTLKQSRGADH